MKKIFQRILTINRLLKLLFFLIVFIAIHACEIDNYEPNQGIPLAFSTDTVLFDTIFTTIGTATHSFKVYNTNNHAITISSIKLANDKSSNFRLNIDGEMSNLLENIELRAMDSLFIFVEVTLDPNKVNQPMVVQDSIIFTMNSKQLDVDLIAWGQDFVPINGEYIYTTTWTAEKPYLIYNGAWVDSGQVLTIEPGARIYFHKNSFLVGEGAIIAQGTPEKPISFKGDRLEKEYSDIPDQWELILILPSEIPSIFENVEIYNAELGLQVGAIEYPGMAMALLNNIKIQHIGFIGLMAINAVIEANNLLVADCGQYAVLIQAGGQYSFNHCTIGNFWGTYSSRKTPSVAITNNLYDPLTKKEYLGHLYQAKWSNSIIWGNMKNEIKLVKNTNAQFNCQFNNCILRISDSLYNAEPDMFLSTIRFDPKFIDPYVNYNFQLDTLSPAINAGKMDYARLLPFDLKNNSRISDLGPDIGAYERIETK